MHLHLMAELKETFALYNNNILHLLQDTSCLVAFWGITQINIGFCHHLPCNPGCLNAMLLCLRALTSIASPQIHLLLTTRLFPTGSSAPEGMKPVPSYQFTLVHIQVAKQNCLGLKINKKNYIVS